MSDGLTPYGVRVVVQGKNNFGGVLEVLNRGVIREDLVPDKENESQECL